jgi:hypothetical protein
MDPDDLERMFEAKAERMIRFNPDRFYSVIVSAEMFCHIHQISKSTLQRWVDEKVIEPEPREVNGHIKFRLSDVLKFDVAAIIRKRNKQLILSTNERKNSQTAL